MDQFFPPIAEQKLPQSRPEVEDVESAETQDESALDFFNFLDLILMELVAEAHEHEEAEHGVLEVIDQPHRGLRLGGVSEAVDEKREDPLAGVGVCSDAGGVEDLVGEVAAEEAPRGAVGG